MMKSNFTPLDEDIHVCVQSFIVSILDDPDLIVNTLVFEDVRIG